MESLGRAVHSRAEAETVTFSFSPRAENVALARLVAGALAERCGLPTETVEDVRLVVSEACTNAVRAHERCARDEAVSLTCHLDGTFYVEVSDVGCGVDVAGEAELPPPGTAKGGYGIPIMRRVAQQATFGRNDAGGTTVRLVLSGDAAHHEGDAA